MEEDDELRSLPSPETRSPSSPPANGRITVTVAAVPPPPPPPPQPSTPQNSVNLALPLQQQQQPRNGGGREDCWSEGATAVLIEAWGERYLELSRGNLKQKHWKEVADIVNSTVDCGKTPKTDVQCKNRIDTVKKKYKSEKAKIAGGGRPSKWRFYDKLDHLIGPTAKISGSNAGSNSAPAKVPMGVPVGIRSSNQHQKIQPQTQKLSNHRYKIQFRKRPPPADSDSDGAAASPESTDSPPPVSFEKKRGKTPKAENLSVAVEKDEVKGKERCGKNSMRELTEAILKFGEAYEQAEQAKLQQAVEMEKQRMKFVKDLELQRMQFFMKTQVEISKLKHGMRAGNNTNHHNNNSNNKNHSDSSS